jgi:hypothetical protein
MLDRLTNLFVLLAVFGTIIVFSVKLEVSWRTTAPWEEKWIAKQGAHPSHPAERLLDAMRRATVAREYEDARKLRQALDADYIRSGEVLTHFSPDEVEEALTFLAFSLLLLAAPVSFNYVRHGKFRVWNRTA